jgi:uncharacterized protein (DUF1800 family)
MGIGRETVAAIRWSYGFRPGERGPADAAALMAQLAAPDPGAGDGPPPLASLLDLLRERREVRQEQRAGTASEAAMDPLQQAVRNIRRDMFVRRVTAAVLSPQGFRERLVQFWADHFTVRAQGPQLSVFAPHAVEAAIRPNIAGRFADLLIAAETHPGMLLFLNQNDSIGPNAPASRDGERGLNENLAREILELHTIGVHGRYAQKDVRELAKLLTGFTVNLDEGTIFQANRAEPGPEIVLGRSYGGGRPQAKDVIAFLEDVAVHPDTAQHIARKLAVHFVSDEPDPGLVAAVAGTWQATGGDLTAVYATLLDHPAAWAVPFVKARQPWDFTIAMLRAFGAGGPGPLEDMDRVAQRAIRDLETMGQKMMEPGGPNGWPEEPEAWITPQGIAARVEVVQDYARMFEATVDPRAFAGEALRDAATEPLRMAVSAAEQRWEGIALTLLSPEFNRR